MTMDPLEPLTGVLIIVAVHVPFMREVYLQLRLASRLFADLPPARRAAFPDAPPQPAWLFLGSTRFQVAFWGYVKRKDPTDSALQARLKLALRRSMKRKLVSAVLGFIVACALVAAGWRPYGKRTALSSGARTERSASSAGPKGSREPLVFCGGHGQHRAVAQRGR